MSDLLDTNNLALQSRLTTSYLRAASPFLDFVNLFNGRPLTAELRNKDAVCDLNE